MASVELLLNEISININIKVL